MKFSVTGVTGTIISAGPTWKSPTQAVPVPPCKQSRARFPTWVRRPGQRLRAPPYAVSLSGLSSASNAVVTQNAMEGDGGGWTVGYGSNWFSSTNLNLGCDEDQVTDTERAHATEPVSYIVFE